MKIKENMEYIVGEQAYIKNDDLIEWDLVLILGREWGKWRVYNTETKMEELSYCVYSDEPEIDEENKIRHDMGVIIDSLFKRYGWGIVSVSNPQKSRELREYGKDTKRCIVASKFSNLNIRG